MKQTARILSTYTADVSGVASALYELGGMVVIHDPSGCNSTYNTHDELRWFDHDSLIFISGLSELDAIMGSDDKLIADTVRAAQELSPAFIAIAGTPIPMMSGVDFDAIAAQVEAESGVPTFGLASNGMHDYVVGAGMALAAVAERLTEESVAPVPCGVNLLGATPLDFALSGTEKSIQQLLVQEGFTVCSCWAMGSTLEQLRRAGEAQVNLVVSSTGLAAAQTLQKKFGTPYVVGLPVGCVAGEVIAALREAIRSGEDQLLFGRKKPAQQPRLTLIGEAVTMSSLAAAVERKFAITTEVICPLETPKVLADYADLFEGEEESLEAHLRSARAILADPLFRHIVSESIDFYDLPHVAFSGRIWAEKVPDWLHIVE